MTEVEQVRAGMVSLVAHELYDKAALVPSDAKNLAVYLVKRLEDSGAIEALANALQAETG